MWVINMPSKPLKPCATIGCSNLTRNKYCDQHKHKGKEATRYYNRYVRDKTITAFYKSKEWLTTRKLVLERQNYLCQQCLRENRITKADMVHHKTEVKEDWSKRLDLSNLEGLCNSCHNKIHGAKKGD
jgi:5-methylcytosine-specific restriction enzyme A